MGDEIASQLPGLRNRKLRSRRADLAIDCVDGGRAIAQRPQPGPAGHLAIGFGHDATAKRGHGELIDQRMAARTDRANDGVSRQAGAVDQIDAVCVDSGGACAQTNIDAALAQRLGGGFAESGRQLRQQAVQVVQQGDAQFIGLDPAIVAVGAVDEVSDGTSDFHTGEAPANHDEVAQRATLRLVTDQLDVGQPLQQAVADVHRVTDELERQGVLDKARDDLQVGALAECQHQVIEGDLERPCQGRADQNL